LRCGLLVILVFVTGLLSSARTDPADTDKEAPDDQPLWEVGAVAGGGYLPDYPASDENHFRGLVLPFAIYRGDVLRLGDRGAIRGIVADKERIEFDLGLDAAFPVDSDDNDAREGMSDLDFLLELGPRLTYRILPRSHRDELDLSLATRAVISTDFRNWRYQGITVNPSFTYRRNHLFGRDLSGVLSIGPLFGFDGLNNYFYRASRSDERPGRPRFNAHDGYIGTETSAGLSWGIFENLRVFGGVQLGYWKHAANENSPLHRDNTTLAIGGGVRWSILTSERQVPL